MRVLVACEESQRVCIAFREKGHEAYSCDIIDCSGGHPEWHIKGDVLEILEPKRDGGVTTFNTIRFITGDSVLHIIDKWDMIIAFPPCTDLCVSGARHFAQKIADGRQQKSIDFFMNFANADCDKIAIENPVGIMSTKYRKPDQIIQPYMFGDHAKKTTCLWLKGLPKLEPTDIVDEGEIVEFVSKKGVKKRFPKWLMDALKSPDRSKIRSKTFLGIANAMAEQWG